jgi:hypothetical protein
MNNGEPFAQGARISAQPGWLKPHGFGFNEAKPAPTGPKNRAQGGRAISPERAAQVFLEKICAALSGLV